MPSLKHRPGFPAPTGGSSSALAFQQKPDSPPQTKPSLSWQHWAPAPLQVVSSHRVVPLADPTPYCSPRPLRLVLTAPGTQARFCITVRLNCLFRLAFLLQADYRSHLTSAREFSFTRMGGVVKAKSTFTKEQPTDKGIQGAFNSISCENHY
ncbi:unnamed protein product [Rangifer tarandus platyrhynchus]|uniref:Uncharacterized protein n=1 Tax=Rangifer tarandus platyrhynchus TaxID=3082113 RepID=A0AC59YXQ9_RANTA